MKKEKIFIPVEMIKNEVSTVGYLDVTNLSLTDLINLKEELSGSKVNSICAIDAVICENAGYDYHEESLNKRTKKKIKYPVKKSRAYINKKYK